MKLSLLNKFPHWSEVLAVLNYSDLKGEEIPFVSHKWLSEDELYIDPLGRKHSSVTSKYAGSEDRALVVNGSIHLETFPLSQGKIPYINQPYKVAIEHTTGYSPWDVLQMVDLAEISYKNDPEWAQGSKLIFLMYKKFYDRFMKTDWTSFSKQYYEEYKEKIDFLVDKGFVIPTYIEPSQFWLENVKSSITEKSDNICIEVNWCNLKRASHAKKMYDTCKRLHDYTGKDIDIRLHSYTSESFLKYLDYDFIHLYPYDSISKYDIMDKYKLYFVDGTGLGYETGYRNYLHNGKKMDGIGVDIFYLNGLDSDEPHHGFDGIVQMGATPDYNLDDFLRGVDHSYFSEQIIKESFPHDDVANECFKIITDASDKLLEL